MKQNPTFWVEVIVGGSAVPDVEELLPVSIHSNGQFSTTREHNLYSNIKTCLDYDFFFFYILQSAPMIKQFCYLNFFFQVVMCFCFSSLLQDTYFQKGMVSFKGGWYFLKV